MTQPHCRYCGKAIRKRTHTVYFVKDEEEKARHTGFATFYSYVIGQPTSKAEAQRLVNAAVVSVRKQGYGPAAGVLITQVGTWDGETYEDQFFCTGTHAQDFAYAVLRTEKYKDVGMPAWIKVIQG